jgi:hypothetical protein
MARPGTDAEGQITETWEATTRATTWVQTWDRRQDGYKATRVGGRSGSRRLTISRDDRRYNQSLLPLENQGLDPFTNGTLRLIDAKDPADDVDATYHKTDDELREYFELRDLDAFTEAVSGIQSKLMLHRILLIAESEGTVSQLAAVRELMETRYPIGGSQRTYREMEEAGERLGVAQI